MHHISRSDITPKPSDRVGSITTRSSHCNRGRLSAPGTLPAILMSRTVAFSSKGLPSSVCPLTSPNNAVAAYSDPRFLHLHVHAAVLQQMVMPSVAAHVAGNSWRAAERNPSTLCPTNPDRDGTKPDSAPALARDLHALQPAGMSPALPLRRQLLRRILRVVNQHVRAARQLLRFRSQVGFRARCRSRKRSNRRRVDSVAQASLG